MRGVACSITGTYRKIKSDTEEILKHYPDRDTLIFYTPKKITNYKVEKWTQDFEAEFGLPLIVIPHEDIVTTLMEPSNAHLCDSFLGIHLPHVEETQNAFEAVKEACEKQVESWSRQARIAGRSLIQLRLVRTQNGDDLAQQDTDLETIGEGLRRAERFVLQAPAGAGKTTTLIQLAKKILSADRLCLIIDLPAWVNSGSDILDHIARAPNFRSRIDGAGELARLFEKVHVDFLLNGWNEVSDVNYDMAIRSLAGLDRSYPAAGIIIASRPHYVSPRISGAVHIRIQEVAAEQRRQFICDSADDGGPELLSRIEGDQTLEAITRNPLMLSEVMNLHNSGEDIPNSRLDILHAMVKQVRDSDDHRQHLSAEPLFGFSEEYLSALAFDMTRQGVVIAPDSDARRSVSVAASSLRERLQISVPPEPQAILNALSSHHLLERIDYPDTSYRFLHQRFLEFFAALEVARRLVVLANEHNSESVFEFQKGFLDKPAWEEPLLMVSSAIGARSQVFGPEVDPVEIGTFLVEWAITVDPIFAAEISRECGTEVWAKVGSSLGEALRGLYQDGDENLRRCALAGMFATGSPDFMDITVPLLCSGDSQVRLRAYRSAGEFHYSSLGSNWRQVVHGWDEEMRVSFLFEISHQIEAVNVAKDFANTDPSEIVRGQAIKILSWLGANNTLISVLENLSDDELTRILSQGVHEHDLPSATHTRVVAALRTAADSVEGVTERLRLLERLAKLGDPAAIGEIKTEIEVLPESDVRNIDEAVIVTAMDLIQDVDEVWTSNWIAHRIAQGTFWADRWISRVEALDPELLDHILEKLCNEEVESRYLEAFASLLEKGADGRAAETIFGKLFELETRRIEAGEEGAIQSERHISSQLIRAARKISPSFLIVGLRNTLSVEPTLGEFVALIGFVGAIDDDESGVCRGMSDTDRSFLQDLLEMSVPVVNEQNDFGGGMKARLALALARVGNGAQLGNLRDLIHADIARVRQGREARGRGERGDAANGAMTTWSRWHVLALTWLGAEVFQPTLIELLDEPEYEKEAAAALASLAGARPLPMAKTWSKLLSQIGGVRRDEDVDERRRDEYSEAISTRVLSLLEQASDSEDRDWLNFRARALASVLAYLDPASSIELVLRTMRIESRGDGWKRVAALEHLLVTHACLPTDSCLAILDPIVANLRAGPSYDNQTVFLLERCLSIAALLDNPPIGHAWIREVLASAPLPGYAQKNLVAALGRSQSDESLELLIELAQESDGLPEAIAREWVDAVAAIGNARSRNVLMSQVDPDITEWNLALPRSAGTFLAGHIATFAASRSEVRNRIYHLCSVDLPGNQRQLLANVVRQIGSEEAIITGLNLIRDDLSPSVPYDLEQALEDRLVGRRDIGGSRESYELVPMNGDMIRKKLIELVMHDEHRRRAARGLLARIESWRLDYGKPTYEPRHPSIETGFQWLSSESPSRDEDET